MGSFFRTLKGLSLIGGLLLMCGIIWISIQTTNPEGKVTKIKIGIPEGNTTGILVPPKLDEKLPRPEGSKIQPKRDSHPPVLQKKVLTPAPVVVIHRRGTPLSPNSLLQNPPRIPANLGDADGHRPWSFETSQHRGFLHAASYSPDGQWLATAGDDGFVRLWDPRQNPWKIQALLPGHTGRILELDWFDSKTLASREENQIRTWEIQPNGAVKPGKIIPAQGVQRMATSPTGKLIAVSNAPTPRPGPKTFSISSPGISLLEVASGQRWTRLNLSEKIVTSIAFSPDGDRVATGGSDQLVKIWNVQSGDLLSTSGPGHNKLITALSWSPDGKAIASVCQDEKIVRVWAADSGKLLKAFPEIAQKPASLQWVQGSGWKTSDRVPLDFLEVDPKSSLAVLTTAWPPPVLESQFGRFAMSFGGDPVYHHPASGALAPDGSSVVYLTANGSSRGAAAAFDLASGNLLCNFLCSNMQLNPIAPVWSQDGKPLASFQAHPNNEVWSLPAHPRETLKPTALGEGNLRLFEACHPYIAYALTEEPLVRIRRLSSGEFVGNLSGHEKGDMRDGLLVRFQNCHRQCSSTVRLWGSPSGKEFVRLGPFPGFVSELKFSPDGELLACCVPQPGKSSIGEFQIYRLSDLTKPIQIIPGYTKDFAFSPDGKLFAYRSGRRVVVVEIAKAQATEMAKVQTWDLPASPTANVVDLQWIDPTHLAASYTTEFRVWDVYAKDPTLVLPNLPGGDISPDGKLLLSRSENRFDVWDPLTGNPLGGWVLLSDRQFVAFDAQGNYFTSPKVSSEIVFSVKTKNGFELLDEAAFRKRYSWSNQPQAVRLLDH